MICSWCGGAAVLELAEAWSDHAFLLETCCPAAHEEVCAGMAEDPAWARDLLRHLGAEVLLGHGLRRVADTGCGQLLLDWNLQIRPVGFARVADFVRCHHAHNAAPTAWRYGAAITNGASLLGVVMVGNPVARGLMGRGTVEVNRLCIGGGTPQRHLAVEGLGGITRAVAEFGRDVLAANPGASFDIFINMAKGQRKPRGFDDAEKAGTFAHHAFLREDAGEDATSRKLVSPPVAAAAAPAAPAAREGGRGGKRAKRGGVPHPVPRRKGEGLTARRCAAPLPRRRGAAAAWEVFGEGHPMEIRRILSGRRPAQASLLLATEAGEPVSCTRCSRTFPTDPSTAVDCPVCRAGEGEPCRREPEGGFHRSHYTRAAIARRLGRMSECPALSWDGLHALPAPRAPRGPTPPATTKLEGNAR